MTDVRVTQGAVQVAYTPTPPDVRITQGAIQVAHNDTSPPPVTEQTGSVRDTQSAFLVMAEGDSEARVTQSGLMVMYEPLPPARVTQSPWLVVAEFDADTRISQTAILAMVDHVACVTKWCQTWTITRTDGQIFAFTSLDRDVVFRGVTHKSCDSLASAATEMASSLGSTGNSELDGILSDDSITEEDLYNGLFDGALVEIWMIPWENAGGEIPFRLLAGTMGDVSQGKLSFNAEVITPGATMQQKPLLDVYTPGCRYELGDDRCKFDLDATTVSGSVTGLSVPSGPNSANRRIFIDSSRAEAEGFFEHGEITWTSGANTGLSSEVKSFSGGNFVLWDALLHPIQIGDSYTAKQGCDKASDTCKNKFNNFVNYGGFPDVPGQDQILKTPDAK